ncbi:GH1 family beta-glucosidase [Isoptericola sp. BMS4]|uniref:GH1 family beta-glucosidase n=1 Tax=Isoptericola sp. BMS4 TaxID=2527875 RepID=UPI00141EBE25|nr:GH1 family beta-glucosidase [Isoptericola sp. BMS4]
MSMSTSQVTAAERAAAIARRVPPSFLWGAGTAAPQIEGGRRLDGRADSIWDTFAGRPGTVRGGETPSTADDHYRRWRSDVDLMGELGLQAYRFSLAWPRIVPAADGRVEPRGLDFYDRLVDALLARGIEPFVTLYHWDLPQWVQDRGGWPARDTAELFAEYAGHVAARLGDRVRHWTTLNEPWVFVFAGHLEGAHAPGLRDPDAAVRAMHHALLAHGQGVRVLREALPADARVGVALDMMPTMPATDRPEDVAAAARHDLYRNWLFCHPILRGAYREGTRELLGAEPPVVGDDLAVISAPVDFVGVNYYHRSVVVEDDAVPLSRARETAPPGTYTAMGWEVYPAGLEEILAQLHDRYAPRSIYVTENGSAWDDEAGPDGRVEDHDRTEYLAAHLESAAACVERGVSLDGYFAWSLLDNFEWAEGYGKRFGLVRVDYATQRRTIKRSGELYRAVLHASAAGRGA